MSRPVLGPVAYAAFYPVGTRGSFLPGIKQLGHEADHLPASSAKVKNVWSHTSIHLLHLPDVVFN